MIFNIFERSRALMNDESQIDSKSSIANVPTQTSRSTEKKKPKTQKLPRNSFYNTTQQLFFELVITISNLSVGSKIRPCRSLSTL